MVPIGPLIPAIIAGVSAIGSAISANRQNKRQEKLVREQRQFDVDMWNRQNAYNTPLMQRQRMEDAGFNPNLFYSQGNSGTASSVTAHSKPGYEDPFGKFVGSVVPAISQYQDLRIKQAQEEGIQKQNRVLEQDIIARALDNVSKQNRNSLESYRIPYYQLQARDENSSRFWKSEQVNADALLKDVKWRRELQFEAADREKLPWITEDVKYRSLIGKTQYELDRDLKPYGVTSSDPLWQRKLLPIIEQFLMRSITGGRNSRLYDLNR